MKLLRIDHVAHPSYDARATHRFWTDVMGCPLVAAIAAESDVWQKPYLAMAFAIGSSTIDFFELEGVERPAPEAVPHGTRHVAIVVDSRDEVDAWEQRLADHSIDFRIETHAEGDVHLYFDDPNGLVVEISSVGDATDPAKPPEKDPRRVLEQWLWRRGGS